MIRSGSINSDCGRFYLVRSLSLVIAYVPFHSVLFEFGSCLFRCRFHSVLFGPVGFGVGTGSVAFRSLPFAWTRFHSVRFDSVRFGSVCVASIRSGSIRFVRFDPITLRYIRFDYDRLHLGSISIYVFSLLIPTGSIRFDSVRIFSVRDRSKTTG